MPIRSILTVTALVAALTAGCGGEDEPTTESPEATASEPTASEPTASEHEPEPEPSAGTAIGNAFDIFARGGDVPPMADEVALYLGNALTGVMVPGLATDRPAWATCTEVGHYAGRSCPISPLTVVKQQSRMRYVAGDLAHNTCLKTYGPIPPDLRKLDRVTGAPSRGSVDSCIDDFAVVLFTNDEGELVAVSTLLGEP